MQSISFIIWHKIYEIIILQQERNGKFSVLIFSELYQHGCQPTSIRNLRILYYNVRQLLTGSVPYLLLESRLTDHNNEREPTEF